MLAGTSVIYEGKSGQEGELTAILVESVSFLGVAELLIERDDVDLHRQPHLSETSDIKHHAAVLYWVKMKRITGRTCE